MLNEKQTWEIISVVRIGEWQVLEVRFSKVLRPVEMVGLLKLSVRLTLCETILFSKITF